MLTLRAALNTLIVAVATILGAVAALVVRVGDRTGNAVLVLARWWSKGILTLSGVGVTVTVRTPLDPNRSYVFMANHLSAVDIWALYVALPVPVRMIAKKQLAAIPLFGWAMWAGRFIFIDRQNAISARRSMEQAKERIRGGESVLVFPEGTRSPDGSLGPFKKGGFHLAVDAGVQIVPVALTGTRECMPRGSVLLRPGHVQVTVGAPFGTEGVATEDRIQLVERVRTAIATMIDEQRTQKTLKINR